MKEVEERRTLIGEAYTKVYDDSQFGEKASSVVGEFKERLAQIKLSWHDMTIDSEKYLQSINRYYFAIQDQLEKLNEKAEITPEEYINAIDVCKLLYAYYFAFVDEAKHADAYVGDAKRVEKIINSEVQGVSEN